VWYVLVGVENSDSLDSLCERKLSSPPRITFSICMSQLVGIKVIARWCFAVNCNWSDPGRVRVLGAHSSNRSGQKDVSIRVERLLPGYHASLSILEDNRWKAKSLKLDLVTQLNSPTCTCGFKVGRVGLWSSIHPDAINWTTLEGNQIGVSTCLYQCLEFSIKLRSYLESNFRVLDWEIVNSWDWQAFRKRSKESLGLIGRCRAADHWPGTPNNCK